MGEGVIETKIAVEKADVRKQFEMLLAEFKQYQDQSVRQRRNVGSAHSRAGQ